VTPTNCSASGLHHGPHAADRRHQIHDRPRRRSRSAGRPAHLQLRPRRIIKETALIAALKSGKVAAAGLDVYEDEPLAADSELRKLPRSPHAPPGRVHREAGVVGIEIAEQIADVLAAGLSATP